MWIYFKLPQLPIVKEKIVKNKVKEIFQNVYQKHEEIEIGESYVGNHYRGQGLCLSFTNQQSKRRRDS